MTQIVSGWVGGVLNSSQSPQLHTTAQDAKLKRSSLWQKGFVEQVGFELRAKSKDVMDGDTD